MNTYAAGGPSWVTCSWRFDLNTKGLSKSHCRIHTAMPGRSHVPRLDVQAVDGLVDQPPLNQVLKNEGSRTKVQEPLKERRASKHSLHWTKGRKNENPVVK